MSSNLIATSLSKTRFESVFLDGFKEHLDRIDLSVGLIYLFDTCHAAALPYLAEQFDVLGFKGWSFCETDEQKRELLKSAVELHRKKGTRFAIRRAFQSVGYTDVTFLEGQNISNRYDGIHDYDGTIFYGSNEWATFDIIVDIGPDKGVVEGTGPLLSKLIDEYKPIRCHRRNLLFKQTISEELVDIVETVSLNMAQQLVNEDVDLLEPQMFVVLNYQNGNRLFMTVI